jgi:hypothetical protein
LNWRAIRQVGILSESIHIWQQLYRIGPKVSGFSNVWRMAFPWWLLPA